MAKKLNRKYLDKLVNSDWVMIQYCAERFSNLRKAEKYSQLEDLAVAIDNYAEAKLPKGHYMGTYDYFCHFYLPIETHSICDASYCFAEAEGFDYSKASMTNWPDQLTAAEKKKIRSRITAMVKKYGE